MIDNTAQEIYSLLPNGKCPNCKTKIRVIDPEYTLYKIRLLKIDHDNTQMVKCSNCKKMVLFS